MDFSHLLKKVAKNICNNLSGKYSQKIIDHAKNLLVMKYTR